VTRSNRASSSSCAETHIRCHISFDTPKLVLTTAPIMQRSVTADAPSVSYEQAQAIVDFVDPAPPAPGLPPFQVRFRFAPGGAFDSFLHFHAEHSEYLYCQQGRIRLTLGTETRWVGPDDGPIEITQWTPHRWEVLPDSDVETVVWEQSTPDPEMKELFFRCVLFVTNSAQFGR
jgi:quercetin dioxygenase-like cupin family protein